MIGAVEGLRHAYQLKLPSSSTLRSTLRLSIYRAMSMALNASVRTECMGRVEPDRAWAVVSSTS